MIDSRTFPSHKKKPERKLRKCGHISSYTLRDMCVRCGQEEINRETTIKQRKRRKLWRSQ